MIEAMYFGVGLMLTMAWVFFVYALPDGFFSWDSMLGDDRWFPASVGGLLTLVLWPFIIPLAFCVGAGVFVRGKIESLLSALGKSHE